MEATIPAVIYARFSSDKQRVESIEDQERVCRAYAEGHGMEVVGTYADEALSGTSDHRPQFLKMVADARGRRWDMVLVYKFDRFSRDRYDAAVYKHRLKLCGVRVVSATEWVPETPEGVLMEAVLEGYAEFYSKQLAQNVRRGMEGNARKCRTNGVRVFGYRRAADGTFAVHEPEAQVVREVFSRYVGGETLSSILSDMRARGVTSAKGSPVSRQWIDVLVHNRRYIGEYSWGGVIVPGGMPAIVGHGLFQAAQHRGRGRVSHPDGGSYPLSGKLFDSEGGAWTGASATSGTGASYRYYALGKGPGAVRVPQADMETACFRAVCDALSDARRLREAAERAARSSRDDRGVEAARRGLVEVERAQRNILRAVEAGVVPDGTRERIEELRRRKALYEDRLRRSEAGFSAAEAMRALSRLSELSTPREVCERAVRRAVTVRGEHAVVVTLVTDDDEPPPGMVRPSTSLGAPFGTSWRPSSQAKAAAILWLLALGHQPKNARENDRYLPASCENNARETPRSFSCALLRLGTARDEETGLWARPPNRAAESSPRAAPSR
jgi:DNA invertase Pin-like site-specific DNA recombinase